MNMTTCFQPQNFHLDNKRLAEMRQELGGSFAIVIKHFQSGLLTRPEKIKQAIVTNDPKLTAQESHSLKSVCKQIGLYEMGELAGTIETLANTGNLQGAEPLVGKLLMTGTLAYRELTKYCTGS